MFGFEKRWVRCLLSSFGEPGHRTEATNPKTSNAESLPASLPDSLNGEGEDPSIDEHSLLNTFMRMRRFASRQASVGLRVAVWMVVLAPFWLERRFITFPRLAPKERVRILGRLLTHSSFAVRELTTLLKLYAALALFRIEHIRRRSHYDRDRALGSPVRAPARPRLPIVPNDWEESGPVEKVASAEQQSAQETVYSDSPSEVA